MCCFTVQDDARFISATQLVSIAPTQADCGEAAAAAAAEAVHPLHAPLLPSYPRPQREEKRPWGLQQEASYFRELDQERLAETEEVSRQTTPAGSRAASPGPCTAPQQQAADLAAVITQQLQQQQHTPCSEEIARHYPRVQASRAALWQRGGALCCSGMQLRPRSRPRQSETFCLASRLPGPAPPCPLRRSGMPSTQPAWGSSSWSRCGCGSSSGTARTEASLHCSGSNRRCALLTACTGNIK